jgi:hypothetical protein
MEALDAERMADGKGGLFISLFLGAVGGALAALVGAGILLPPSEWSPAIETTGTADVHLDMAATPYERDILVQGEFAGVAVEGGWFELNIHVGDELCNTPNRKYKNPTTAAMLTAKDVCFTRLKKGAQLSVKVSAPQSGVDSWSAAVRVQHRRVGRALW